MLGGDRHRGLERPPQIVFGFQAGIVVETLVFAVCAREFIVVEDNCCSVFAIVARRHRYTLFFSEISGGSKICPSDILLVVAIFSR